MAVSHGHSHIAFPALSCGVFGYPLEEAAEAALVAIQEFSNLEVAKKMPKEQQQLKTVTFVMFEKTTVKAWLNAAQKLGMTLKGSVSSSNVSSPSTSSSSSSTVNEVSKPKEASSAISKDKESTINKGLPPTTKGQFLWQVAAQKSKNALAGKSMASVVEAATTSKS